MDSETITFAEFIRRARASGGVSYNEGVALLLIELAANGEYEAASALMDVIKPNA